jgi:hypothetical protein
MTATNINIGFGGELEARAQSVLADLGLDVPTAFNIFLTHVVEKKPSHLKWTKKGLSKKASFFGIVWLHGHLDGGRF